MMDRTHDRETMLKLLEEKQALFQQYEEETKALVWENLLEQGEMHMANRQRLMGQIDGVNRQLEACISADPEEDRVRDTLANRCSPDGLEGGWRVLYQLGRELLAHFDRISRLEEQAMARMNGEREALLEKIKQNNRSQDAKASRYLNQTVAFASKPMGNVFGKA